MKWRLCLFWAISVACGPSVSASAGGGDGTSDNTSSSGSPPSPGSIGATTADPSGSTGGSSSAGDTDTDAEPVELCLRGTAQPLIDPEDTLLRILDTDGNGRDEVWMLQLQWDPVREIQSSILRPFELSERGSFVPRAEIELPGAVEALADVDGDGHVDAVLTQWDDETPWWQAGLPAFEFDETAQPVQGIPPLVAGSWMDVTGDNAADYMTRSEAFGFQVLVGDGTGSLTPAGASQLEFSWPHKALPVPALGQLVLLFEEPVLGFGFDINVVRTVAVDENGQLQVVAESQALDNDPRFVGDLDGDAIADVIGLDGADNALRYLGSGQGPYEEMEIVPGIRDALVGEFVQEQDVEILLWDGKGQVHLHRRDGTAWPAGIPVTADSQWDSGGQSRVLEADGTPGSEILRTDETYSLWRVEEC